MGKNSKARRDAKARKRAKQQRRNQAESTHQFQDWPDPPAQFGSTVSMLGPRTIDDLPAHNHPVISRDPDGHPIPELGGGMVWSASLVQAMGDEFPGVWQGAEPPTIMDVTLSTTYYGPEDVEPGEEPYTTWGAEWHWRNHNTAIEDFTDHPAMLIESVTRTVRQLAGGRTVELVWHLEESEIPGSTIEQSLSVVGVTLPTSV